MAGASASGYALARLDEIEEVSDGRAPWRPVRHHFGIAAFGVTSWTARAAGDRIINEHDEADDGHEELYLVPEGRASFELDGERRDAPAGTSVFVRPGVRRTAFAEEAGTTILAVGPPGQAHVPGGRQLWAPLRPPREAGEYAEAADRATELVEAHPQLPGLLDNVACCESLAGRREAAIEHLWQAIARSERFRSFARGDSDSDPIRNQLALESLIGG